MKNDHPRLNQNAFSQTDSFGKRKGKVKIQQFSLPKDSKSNQKDTETPAKDTQHKSVESLQSKNIDVKTADVEIQHKENSSFSRSKNRNKISFDILRVEENDDHFILHGADIVCIVKDFWMNATYLPGMNITVSSCLCCKNDEIFAAQGSEHFLNSKNISSKNDQAPCLNAKLKDSQSKSFLIDDEICKREHTVDLIDDKLIFANETKFSNVSSQNLEQKPLSIETETKRIRLHIDSQSNISTEYQILDINSEISESDSVLFERLEPDSNTSAMKNFDKEHEELRDHENIFDATACEQKIEDSHSTKTCQLADRRQLTANSKDEIQKKISNGRFSDKPVRITTNCVDNNHNLNSKETVQEHTHPIIHSKFSPCKKSTNPSTHDRLLHYKNKVNHNRSHFSDQNVDFPFDTNKIHRSSGHVSKTFFKIRGDKFVDSKNHDHSPQFPITLNSFEKDLYSQNMLSEVDEAFSSDLFNETTFSPSKTHWQTRINTSRILPDNNLELSRSPLNVTTFQNRTNSAEKPIDHISLKTSCDDSEKKTLPQGKIMLSDDDKNDFCFQEKSGDVSLFSMFSDPFLDDILSDSSSAALSFQDRTEEKDIEKTNKKIHCTNSQKNPEFRRETLYSGESPVNEEKNSADSSQVFVENIQKETSRDQGLQGFYSQEKFHAQSRNSSTVFKKAKKIVEVNKSQNIILINGSVHSVTAICASLKCILVPILEQFIMDISFEWKHHSLAIGVIMHSVIEKCLETGNYGLKFIMDNIHEEIKKNTILIFTCNTTERKIKNECVSYVQSIMSLKSKKLQASKIEERKISTSLGIKGCIDAIVEKNREKRPLEIKTGKNLDLAHRAQLLLYLLMMNEAENTHTSTGILYYAQKNELIFIDLKHDEACGILALKNKISSLDFINRYNILAESNLFGSKGIISAYNESLVSTQGCGKTLQPICSCDPSSLCYSIYSLQNLDGYRGEFLRRQWEGVYKEEISNSRKPKFKCTVLKQEENTLFLTCSDVLCFEACDYVEIYTAHYAYLTYGKLEKNFFPNIQVTVPINNVFLKSDKLYISESSNKLFYKMMRFSILKFGLTCDLIEKSHEKSFMCQNSINSPFDLCNDILNPSGMISELSCAEAKNLELRKNLITSSTLHVSSQTQNQENLNRFNNCTTAISEFPLSSQGDKNDQFAISQNQNMTHNLKDVRHPASDQFYQNSISDFVCLRDSQLDAQKLINIPDVFKDEFTVLNDDQRHALYLSLNCDKYNIIHGFPGSGKSTLISLLIKILAYYGKKILLICYTNLAIDNILKKTTVRFYRALKENINGASVDEIKEKLENLDLVAGTCFSFSDIAFIDRKFDFCIIDEASQMHFPLALTPVSISRKFILVGDHLQLKPLSKASEDLRYSLFQHLIDSKNFCKLKKQYRMGDRIMSLSNQFFYNNEMIGTGAFSEISFIDSLSYASYDDILNSIHITKATTILCYFNKQVSLIRSIVKDKCAVETVDRYQGSENDQIILVFDPVIDCDIMSSKERLNVGLTRARKKLTFVGDKSKMLKIEILKNLLDIL